MIEDTLKQETRTRFSTEGKMTLLLVLGITALLLPVIQGALYDYGPHVDPILVTDAVRTTYVMSGLQGTYRYYGTSYTSTLYINTNGNVCFDGGNREYRPADFPFVAIPDEAAVMVATFWADVALWACGTIYIREDTDSSTLSFATSDVRSAFPCSDDFSATHILVVTWDKVCEYYHYWYDYPEGEGLFKNTFQVVLITDGTSTYVKHNYGVVEWILGYDTGYEEDYPAMGFNAGDGERYWVHPYSHTEDMININQTSNIGVAGEWIFKVDGEQVRQPDDLCVDCYTCGDTSGATGPAADTACNTGGTTTCMYGCKTKLRCKTGGSGFKVKKECAESASACNDVTLDKFPALWSVNGVDDNLLLYNCCSGDGCNSDAAEKMDTTLENFESECDDN